MNNTDKKPYAVWEYSVRRRRVLDFHDNERIASPEAVVNLLVALKLHEQEQEQFLTIVLDTKFRIKGFCTVAIGSVSHCFVEAREVFRAAVLLGASCIVVAHNHPSLDPTPSSRDIACTKDLVEAGGIIGIEVVDHIILGSPTGTCRSEIYISFREEHLI